MSCSSEETAVPVTFRRVLPAAASQRMKTRISSRITTGGVPWLGPLSWGSQASILPSSCLKWNEHMKKMQRQKMTSTMAVTLISTGLSDSSPMFPPPPMIASSRFQTDCPLQGSVHIQWGLCKRDAKGNRDFRGGFEGSAAPAVGRWGGTPRGAECLSAPFCA